MINQPTDWPISGETVLFKRMSVNVLTNQSIKVQVLDMYLLISLYIILLIFLFIF